MSSTGNDLAVIALTWMMQGCGPPAGPTAPAPSTEVTAVSAPAPGRSQNTIVLDSDGRTALATLERLELVAGCEEASPGLLRLQLGRKWNRAAAEYHLSDLYNGYAPHVQSGHTVALELWQEGAKIGEYTADGLLIGPEFSSPR